MLRLMSARDAFDPKAAYWPMYHNFYHTYEYVQYESVYNHIERPTCATPRATRWCSKFQPRRRAIAIHATNLVQYRLACVFHRAVYNYVQCTLYLWCDRSGCISTNIQHTRRDDVTQQRPRARAQRTARRHDVQLPQHTTAVCNCFQTASIQIRWWWWWVYTATAAANTPIMMHCGPFKHIAKLVRFVECFIIYLICYAIDCKCGALYRHEDNICMSYIRRWESEMPVATHWL